MTATGAAPGRTPPPDEDVRAEVRDSSARTMLVEAAAGTGKTTLLVDRILGGVREGRVRLAGTVAITFTEKAAGELEDRLRTKLAEAWQQAPRDSAERRHLQTALEEIDRAAIGTIHAFCARLLREKPAEAGVDPEFAVLETSAADLLRERCWREWIDGQMDARAEPLREVLRAEVPLSALKGPALSLLDAPEVLEGERFVLRRPAALPAELSSDLVGGLAAVRKVLAGLERTNEHSRVLVQAVEGLDDLGADAVRRLGYAAAGVPCEDVLRSVSKGLRDEAVGVLEPWLAAAASLGAHLAADVFEWLLGFVRHYGRAKQARAVLDFQDLLWMSARLLRRDRAVRRFFQLRFSAFFVDEFQDTDPLQAEVVAFLCEDPEAPPADRMEDVRLADGKLFAVGDPKQSIYRFRRADVLIYERFKGLFGPAGFGEDRTRTVSCNFRSTSRLLDVFNRTFERLFAVSDRPDVYQAAHVPLGAPADAAPGGAPVLAVCPPAGVYDPKRQAGQGRRFEADALARTIRALLDGALPGADGLTVGPSGVAVLFRSLTGIDVYRAAFDALGIPYRVLGGKGFYRREHVAETLTVLEAVDDPLNEAAVVGALRSSFFGITDEELFRHREAGGRWNYQVSAGGSAPVQEALGHLARWHARRNRVPAAQLLREILAATRAVQAFRLKPAGRQRAADIDLMLGRLRELAGSAPTFSAAVRYLSAMRDGGAAEQESASGAEPGDDSVCLMTVHKAKGLAFDVVVLADLAHAFASVDKVGPLVVDRRGGQMGFRLTAGLRSQGYDDLAECEHRNVQAEERRLLYVACTRARKLLVLPLHWARDTAAGSQQADLLGTGLFADAESVPFGREQDGVYYLDTAPWAGELGGGPRPRVLPQDDRPDAEGLLRRRDEWRLRHRLLADRASAADPFVLPSVTDAEAEGARPADETARGVGGKDFGSLFHNIMARVPLRAGEDGGDPGPLVRGLARIEADLLGLDDAATEEAARLALEALAHPEFRALLDAATGVATEVAFAVPLAALPFCADDRPGLLEGSIDLLLSGPGRTVIVDYKTDRVPPGRHEEAAAAYWPQLGLYALAAGACGRAAGEAELALFFVRTGDMLRRRLDADLRRRLADRLSDGGRSD
ncbi:MAG: UvrD-helicase domain-containing protein [Candidatus Brocadiaceae bacterium]|nr:UvrD-helicase domain-containing protein [Candidatus Brocadiaceae bacterium]